jgi:hypothetical protein
MGLCHYAAYLLIVASSVACLPIVVQRSSSSTCGPAGWEDIVFFYLLNYGAHAMTVVNLPGECDLVSLIWATLALLLPYSGIIKACTSIAYALPRSKDPLRRALFAGALGEVVEKTSGLSGPGKYTAVLIFHRGIQFAHFRGMFVSWNSIPTSIKFRVRTVVSRDVSRFASSSFRVLRCIIHAEIRLNYTGMLRMD